MDQLTPSISEQEINHAHVPWPETPDACWEDAFYCPWCAELRTFWFEVHHGQTTGFCSECDYVAHDVPSDFSDAPEPDCWN